jgi:hypothetical protein
MFKSLFFVISICVSWHADAINITINNAENKPLANTVAWLTANNSSEVIIPQEAPYAMGQKNRAFTPHILVAPKNTKV